MAQGKTTVFDTDDFMVIKNAILKIAGIDEPKTTAVLKSMSVSLNVVSDHMRTLVCTLADGCTFAAEGRGYVLRRVLRRAVRQAYKLCPDFPKDRSFLAELVPTIVKLMGPFYPEMIEHEKRIQGSIFQEESRFVLTLEAGLQKFQELKSKVENSKIIGAADVFLLHDSFGFPWDLTQILAEESGLSIDRPGFVQLMEAQKEKSRADAKFYKFDSDDSPWILLAPENQILEKEYCGYHWTGPEVTSEGTVYLSEVISKNRVSRVRQLKNKFFELVLYKTPFYPEGGGQTSDLGLVRLQSTKGLVDFEVLDVRKTPSSIVHLLKQSELSDESHSSLRSEDLKTLFSCDVIALTSKETRLATMRNHTATHLLHKALSIELGNDVRQAGSLVNAKMLRFDFTFPKALTPAQIITIENLVNQQIWKATEVTTHVDVEISEAKNMGAMAIFDEKYEDKVRVLQIADFSMELCGGTHVKNTGQIGALKIISEGSVTAGVRRIEALTGQGAIAFMRAQTSAMQENADVLKCNPHDVHTKIVQLKDKLKETEDRVDKLTRRAVNLVANSYVDNSIHLDKGVDLVIAEHKCDSIGELEILCDRLKELTQAIVFVVGVIDSKMVCLCAAPKEHLDKHKKATAGNIIKEFCAILEGKGGGRPDFARGGAPSAVGLDAAIGQLGGIILKLVNI